MATRKQRYETRDPQPQTRDPEPRKQHKPRRYISASMPTVCPDCGHTTRMDNGRHIDQVRRMVLEYRTCVHCQAKLAAGRKMTDVEVNRLCDRAEALAEYEQIGV
jgi:hypothetical protein